MKKKSMIIITLVVAISLLVITAFAGAPQNAGYEAFKNVLKNHSDDEFDEGRATGSFEITDNGNTVIKMDGTFAGSKDEEMSGDFRIITDSLSKDLAVYGLDDVFYIFDKENNDVYVGKDSSNDYDTEYDGRHEFDGDREFTAKEEAIMDYFVGDLANEFELISFNDGTYDLQFELTKNEVPTILNLLSSVDKRRDHDFDRDEECFEDMDLEQYPLLRELHDSKFEMTELVEDVEIEYLNVVLNLDAKQEVKGMLINVIITGLDEKAQNHEITMKANFRITELNNVTINPINLNGKNVIELPEK